MKQFLALLLALCLLFAAGAAAAEQDDDPVLVTVDGEEIRESSPWLQIWIEDILDQAGGEADDEMMELVCQYALDCTVRYTVMKHRLEREGLLYTEEELQAQCDALWSDYVGYIMEVVYGITDESGEAEIAEAQGKAEAYLRDELGVTEEYVRTVNELGLVQDAVEDLVLEGIEVTDEEVEDYYRTLAEEDVDLLRTTAESQLEETGEAYTEEDLEAAAVEVYEIYGSLYGYRFMVVPEGYRGMLYIRLETDEGLAKALEDLYLELGNTEDPDQALLDRVAAAEQALADSVRATADEIAARVEAGEAFEDLLPEYSTDADLMDEETIASGVMFHPYSITFDPNYIDAAMALEQPGDVSGPVAGDDGVYVLYYLRDVPGGPLEFTDDLKTELRGDLLYDRLNLAFDELTDGWVAEADVAWTEAGEPWKLPEESDG